MTTTTTQPQPNHTTLPQLHFIIGIGRSGTTLINQILNANPHCLSTPETKFVMTFYSKYAHQIAINPDELFQDIRTYYHTLRKDKQIDIWKLNYTQLQQQLQQYKPLNYANACRIFLLNMHYLERSNDQVCCIADKNPSYVSYLPQLLQLFPDAKFIISLRDYRAVFNSSQQSKGNPIITPTVRLLRWREHFNILSQYTQAMPDRFFWLPYEKLVHDNENKIRQLCLFLQIPFDTQMSQSHEPIKHWIATHTNELANNPRQQKKWTDLSRPINPMRSESWRQNLSPSQIIFAELICGNIGQQFGYIPTQPAKLPQQIISLLRHLPALIYALPIYWFFARYYFWLPIRWRLAIIARLKH